MDESLPIRLACHPADQGRLEEDTTLAPEPMALPQIGDRLTLRRMVDPQTRQPVPTRVADVVLWRGSGGPCYVVVLTRDH